MASFRDIWNLVVTGDTTDINRKLGGLGKTAESTGATAETSIRNKMGGALSDVAQKIPGVSGLMDKFGLSGAGSGALIGTAVAGGVAAAGLAVEQFVEKSIGEFQRQAQEVLHFKDVSGLAADEASRFVAVADDFGVSGEDLATAIGKMDKAAGTTQHLQDLGIEIGHTKDGVYDAQQTFLNVVDAFNATDDAARQAAIGSTVFGKGWQSSIKLLEQGSGSLKQAFSDVKGFQIFNEKDLQQSEDYRHKMDDLNDAIKGFEREVGQAAIPIVTEFTGQLRDMAEAADAGLKPVGGLNLLLWGAATAVNPAFESSGGNVADVAKSMGQNMDVASRAAEGFMMQIKGNALGQEEYTRKIDAHTEAMKDNQAVQIADANKAWGKAMEENKKKTEDATKALKDYRQATKDVMNDQLGLEGAIYSSLDAVDAYTAKVKDHTATAREQEQANLAVEQSFIAVADQAKTTAEKQAELHGATLDANGAVAAQISALQGLYAQLAPDSPLRVELDRYILALSNIPGQIVTNVDLTGSGLDVLGRSVGTTRREGSGAGGTPSASDGGAIVSSIKAYEASNGTAWRSGPQ